MNKTGKHPLTLLCAALALIVGIAVLSHAVQGQSRETEGARLLHGAIDMHFHMDPPLADGSHDEGVIATIRIARSRGIRALVIKSHSEPTSTLAYQLGLDLPEIRLFGGVVMNRSNGGMNVAAIDYMATKVYGAPGKVVWMPAYDSEIESNPPYPKKPFVPVSRNGELLPEVKEVIAAVARYHLILASGHIAPEEALMVFREGRKDGVQTMIATHAMDLAGKMNMEQMLEAAKIGAIVEFDFRNVLDDGAVRADAIRKIGPERCLISEFWTQKSPRAYAGLDGVGEFVEAMHARGFTDHELDLMFKRNPARLLGLPAE
ncbi:MAG TPA: DUF6282 family protein [Candidatus Acidoferrales bacterium]|jgi:hypothetical protein|nr:DUF6282 family protein [Candidatus Acidoferrales bacterium]